MKTVALVMTAATLLWIAGMGCEKSENPPPANDGGTSGKAQEGERCTSANDCASGLVCSGAGTCQKPGAKGTAEEYAGCGSSSDCLLSLVCSSQGICVKPGTGTEGTSCVGIQDCTTGLVCSAKRLCAKPGSAGAKMPGEECEDQSECALGLPCVAGRCVPVTFWAGATCTPDEGPLRAYFEIPRASKPLADFYRLPFPNDIRRKNGHVDVSGHPNPATALPAEYGDVVTSYLKAINEDVTGFGLNTATFFRLSRGVDLDSITDDKIQLVNIDKDSKGYGGSSGWSFFTTTDRGKYICENYIVVRPPSGHPLSPLTTYAVLLLKGIKDSKGALVAQDNDFKLVLGDNEPTGAEERAAWQAYAPLRAYLKDKGRAASDLLSAAVFTTMDPQAHMSRFREVVQAEAQPEASNLTLCNGTNKSPCENADNPTHVCPTTPSSAFHEIQGRYQTPVFQAGQPPYKTAADGGAISYDASSGKPMVQRREQACFALTVPKTQMPTDGWPVVIFAHGTGGSYRSFIENGTAAALAEVKDATGTVSRMAVISIDGSMHGPRRGSTDKPDELFFNLRNPRAARDNTYQGAADKLQLVRLIKTLALDATKSPTGEALKLDPNRIYFFGHSQGTIEGVPFAAFEPDVKGLVLSGAGGFLIESLLAKTKPVNVAGLVQLALADGNMSMGASHPFLNLLQLYFEEIDSVNYGNSLFYEPAAGVEPKPTFLSYGVADSFTPPPAIVALAKSMHDIPLLKQAAQRCGDGVCNGTESCTSCAGDCKACPADATCGNGTCEKVERCNTCPADCGGCNSFTLVDPPVKDNVMVTGAKKVTAIMVQYVSDGTYDDHHVLFNNPTGRQQSVMFLGTGARDGSPSVSAAP